MFGGNFAPKDWALCNGQLLPIAQNTALFSLLGTTYGGNGQTTFALPDLRGRVPVHQSVAHTIGELAGTESVTLLASQLAPHSHAVGTTGSASDKPATDTDPAGRVFAVPTDGGNSFSTTSTGVLGGAVNTGTDGGSQPHGNMQPYTCVNFCIALSGVFPSRN
ncbi:tail fiber protein [Luteolibacter yonseiensis]